MPRRRWPRYRYCWWPGWCRWCRRNSLRAKGSSHHFHVSEMSELHEEFPGLHANPIHVRAGVAIGVGVTAVEGADLDGISGLAAFEVVAEMGATLPGGNLRRDGAPIVGGLLQRDEFRPLLRRF